MPCRPHPAGLMTIQKIGDIHAGSLPISSLAQASRRVAYSSGRSGPPTIPGPFRIGAVCQRSQTADARNSAALQPGGAAPPDQSASPALMSSHRIDARRELGGSQDRHATPYRSAGLAALTPHSPPRCAVLNRIARRRRLYCPVPFLECDRRPRSISGKAPISLHRVPSGCTCTISRRVGQNTRDSG